jgi:hypothetical protein
MRPDNWLTLGSFAGMGLAVTLGYYLAVITY